MCASVHILSSWRRRRRSCGSLPNADMLLARNLGPNACHVHVLAFQDFKYKSPVYLHIKRRVSRESYAQYMRRKNMNFASLLADF